MSLGQGLTSYEWVEYTGERAVGASPIVNFEMDRSSATRILDLEDFSNYQTACAELLGYSNYSTGRLNRYLPDPFPDRTTLLATHVRAEGKGTSSTATTAGLSSATYNAGARLTVQYNTLPFDVMTYDDALAINSTIPEFYRYVTKTYKPTADVQTMPRGSMVWSEGSGSGKIIDFGPSKLLGFIECQYTWHQIPEELRAALFSTLQAGVGTVNSATFDSAAAETMLLASVDLRPYRDPFGSRVWDIQFRMKYNANTWNKLYYWPDDAFKGVIGNKSGGSGGKLYTSTSFNSLFTPP